MWKQYRFRSRSSEFTTLHIDSMLYFTYIFMHACSLTIIRILALTLTIPQLFYLWQMTKKKEKKKTLRSMCLYINLYSFRQQSVLLLKILSRFCCLWTEVLVNVFFLFFFFFHLIFPNEKSNNVQLISYRK